MRKQLDPDRNWHPCTGYQRVVTGFLFFPKVIDNEQRWLEKATWEERWISVEDAFSTGFWDPLRWIDGEVETTVERKPGKNKLVYDRVTKSIKTESGQPTCLTVSGE